MASYKVEEVDGPTTYYDSSGRVFKIDEYGNALVPYSNKSNSLVPYSNKSNSLVSYPNKSNSLVPATKQSEPSTFDKIKTGLEIANTIANMKNPFSTSGHTVGQSIGSGVKKFVNWWNQPKEETKKAEQQLIEGPKRGGAKKTTKTQTQIVPRSRTQTQIVPRTRTIQPKQVTEVGTVSTMVKRDQIQQAAQRLIEQSPQEDPLYAYERESIRNIEAAQRKRVPWRLPPIDVGMTKMTGFEPFSATADQTFNIFYGSGSIDPFIRS